MTAVIHADTRTFKLPKDGETKRLCLKKHRVLTLLDGQATLTEFWNKFCVVFPWNKGKSFCILAGTKHSIYPISDCKVQEVIYS